MPPHRVQGDAAIIERADVVWLGGECAIVARQRLVEASQSRQHIAAIAQRIGVIGLHRQRAVVTGQRLIVLALRRQDDSEHMMRVEEVRFLGDDLLADLLGLAELPRLVGRDRAVERQRKFRRLARHSMRHRFRFSPPRFGRADSR